MSSNKYAGLDLDMFPADIRRELIDITSKTIGSNLTAHEQVIFMLISKLSSEISSRDLLDGENKILKALFIDKIKTSLMNECVPEHIALGSAEICLTAILSDEP